MCNVFQLTLCSILPIHIMFDVFQPTLCSISSNSPYDHCLSTHIMFNVFQLTLHSMSSSRQYVVFHPRLFAMSFSLCTIVYSVLESTFYAISSGLHYTQCFRVYILYSVFQPILHAVPFSPHHMCIVPSSQHNTQYLPVYIMCNISQST